jgi:cell wall-associated NlpC family hydrolase
VLASAGVAGLLMVPLLAVAAAGAGGSAVSDQTGIAPAAGDPPAAGVSAVLAFAAAQLGRPYRFGGSGPGGWDCSGLVQASYRQAGVELPRVAADQFAATADRLVPLDRLLPGDTVFFGPDAAGIHHVGIYLGDGQMIDAPHTDGAVRVEPLAGWPDLLAATRPLTVAS